MKDNINSFFAEQCGATFYPLWESYGIPDPNNAALSINWNINDARCREVIREYFKIKTTLHINHSKNKKWVCLTPYNLDDNLSTGKSIKEAEINCLKTIYKSSKTNHAI